MVCILINKKQASAFFIPSDYMPPTLFANVNVANKLLFYLIYAQATVMVDAKTDENDNFLTNQLI